MSSPAGTTPKRRGPKGRPEMQAARELLARVLGDGAWHSLDDLVAMAMDERIPSHALFRVVRELGAEKCQCWRLPTQEAA